MPDDRLFHLALGHSAKVNRLTDFERGVWFIYKLASDDFGVMRFSATPLQDAALWLERRPARAVLKALEQVCDVGLLGRFTHQDQTYVYQRDWQTWQKITFPRQTKQPAPSLNSLDLNTQWLFEHHPNGGKLSSWQHPSLRQSTGRTPGGLREPSANPPVLSRDTHTNTKSQINTEGGAGETKPAPDEVGAFMDRYRELHVQFKGVSYLGNPQKDYQAACELVSAFGVDLSEAIAAYGLNDPDPFMRKGTVTVPMIRSRASRYAEELKAKRLA